MGERERAPTRAPPGKGKPLYDAFPPENAGTLVDFLMQLARLEPDQAMERLRKLRNPATDTGRPLLYDPPAAVAVGLATDHPAEAERAFHLWQRTGIQWTTNSHTSCDSVIVWPESTRCAPVGSPRRSGGRRNAPWTGPTWASA